MEASNEIQETPSYQWRYKIQFNHNHEPQLWYTIGIEYTLEEAREKFSALKQHGEWLMSRMQIVSVGTLEIVASHEMKNPISPAEVEMPA